MDTNRSGYSLAKSLLSQVLPRRWVHVQAVGAKAEEVAACLPEADRPTLIAAAWLHDIGHAPDIAVTGFHPLDGARWLREQEFPERIVSLVAHHSCAVFEAEERGLADELAAEFHAEDSLTRDGLWYCDLTSGPDGEDFDILERLAEIRSRYGTDHLVTRFWARAEPTAVAAVRRFENLLTAQGD